MRQPARATAPGRLGSPRCPGGAWPRGRHQRLRERGLTLFEVLVYMVLLTVLIGPVTLVILTSIRTNVENDVLNKVSERNRVALHRIAADVRPSIEASITISRGGRFLGCNLPDGFDGSAVISGDRVGFALRSVAGDPQNGADDNRNGLVDEGELVWGNAATGEVVTVSPGIDLAQSGFSRSGRQVVVTLAHQGFIPHSGDVYSVRRTAHITPRN